MYRDEKKMVTQEHDIHFNDNLAVIRIVIKHLQLYCKNYQDLNH